MAVATVGPHAVSSRPPASMDYTLRVDSAGASDIHVALTIRDAPAEFRIAMATHTEYDDRYWRYLTDLSAHSARGAGTITREDSAVWRVATPPGDVTITYRVHLPSSPQQASWMAHLLRSGGLIGGPHSFLYVVGAEHTPTQVRLILPREWQVATGLQMVAPLTYIAPSVEALIDSPMLVGALRTWRFDIDRVPHDIAFLGRRGGATFDSARFVGNVERIAREAVRMFGRMPYDRYQFLFEDATYGGLEHLNSVSIGTQSVSLARDPNAYLTQIAHEYFHTWNEVHLRPTSWIGLRHVPPAPTGELWLSEGVTLYYADLLLRRAGLYTPDSTRLANLEQLITSYLSNPSHAMVSPEETSRAFNRMGATGDFTPSMFLQGQLLGVGLDLMIRDGSGGSHTLDDVMRSMSAQFSVSRGFSGMDVERAVARACACDADTFFDRFVRAAHAFEFDQWLATLGLRGEVTWSPARDSAGTLVADLRLASFLAPNESAPRLIVRFPGTAWGRAGLHTGDRLIRWNDAVVADPSQIRAALSRLRVGDTVRVRVARDAGPFETTVIVTGYDRPMVHIHARPDATDAQRERFAEWVAGR